MSVHVLRGPAVSDLVLPHSNSIIFSLYYKLDRALGLEAGRSPSIRDCNRVGAMWPRSKARTGDGISNFPAPQECMLELARRCCIQSMQATLAAAPAWVQGG